ncbi:MAG: hypothetical protein Tp1111SUR768151_14 [Prokaryotic dsDNA virus sp.]|nr:MAG: hypothetical protein Tp1111SUR768151_14 [Prokaryotic dsDNA virus sp.]|tara:strand:+ start:5411 stop:7336 length:1926 start_codon:yes stop_codon:yes gene_type:complete
MANRVFDIIFKTRGLDKAKKDSDNLDNSFDQLGRTAKKVAIGFVSFQGALKAVELAQLAAQTETVRRSFGNLAEEPDKMLQSMKRATAGTISEMELMQKFNEASLLGLPLDRFDEMLEIARGAAQATGQSMDFMLNSIVVALGRQSKLMLDNLGIMIDITAANEEFAKAIGKTSNQLTDQEKKQAFVNKALQIGNENLERSGGVIDSNIDSFGRLNASIEDLQVTLGQTFLPIVASVIENMSEFMNEIDAEDLISFSIALGTTSTALGVYTVAQNAANISAKAFSKALPIVVFTTIVAGLTEVVKEIRNIQKIADSTTKSVSLLFVGDGSIFGEANKILDENADLSRISTDELQKLSQGFAELAIDTNQNTETQNFFLEANKKVNEELKTRVAINQDLIIGSEKYKELVQDLIRGGGETEKAYIDSLNGSYAEFISQQMTSLEMRDKEQKFIDRFVASFPEQAKALGLVSSEQMKHKKTVDATIESFNNVGSAASSTSELLAALAGENKEMQLVALQLAKISAIANIAQGVTKAFAQGGVLGFATGASITAAGAAQIATIDAQISQLKKAQYGIDQMISSPTLILAGEAGPERVQVTPSDRPASQQQGALTINFNGPVTSREFVRDTIIPEIDRVQKLGLA